MRRVTEWLATMPSTNARIAVTLLITFGTAVRYWSSASWEPSFEWLGFLLGMSGVDVAQFAFKRKTDATHVEAQAKARQTAQMPAVSNGRSDT